MKITARTILVIALTLVSLLCIYLLSRQGAYDRDIQEWKVKYNVARANSEMIKTNALKEIDRLNTEMAERDAEIAETRESISAKNLRLAEKTRELFDLEAKNQDDIEVVRAQLQIWKDKFNIAEGIIADKDKVIFSLSSKIESQAKIITEYKGMYEDQVKLNRLGEIGFDLAERKLEKRNKITSIAVYILGGIIIYQTIKGE